MLQKRNSTKLTISVVWLDLIRGISCYFMMHLGMTKHGYKYWFFFLTVTGWTICICRYLPGKSNQNTHITLRAQEDWQQLNLSVKNLVKELKTFDLPASLGYLCLSPACRCRVIFTVLFLRLIFFSFFLHACGRFQQRAFMIVHFRACACVWLG